MRDTDNDWQIMGENEPYFGVLSHERFLRRNLTDEDGTTFPCPTCQGHGAVDPANPPPAGMWDVLTKIFFGA